MYSRLVGLFSSAIPHDEACTLHYDFFLRADWFFFPSFQNVCGMSVVGDDHEKLKRYNLSEIYDPTVKSSPAAG